MLNVETLIYRLCEAKFCAETAAGVGRSTTVILMSKKSGGRFLPDGSLRKIRGIWEESLCGQGPPEAILEIMKAMQLPAPCYSRDFFPTKTPSEIEALRDSETESGPP